MFLMRLFMRENLKLQIENAILKVENLMHQNIILQMKIKQHLQKYKIQK